MEKNTVMNYGRIAILMLVLAVLIPFGHSFQKHIQTEFNNQVEEEYVAANFDLDAIYENEN